MGGGHPGPVLAEAALAGSFWWVELPGPGVRKATSTHYSPKAYVLGLMGNILSMASLQGPAVEKDGLWQPLLSPQKTLSLVENDFFTPQTFSRVEKRGGGSPAWPLPSAGSDHCTEREQAEVCVHKGQTDQDTGTKAAAYKQEHHQACSQAHPCGTEYRDNTGKNGGINTGVGRGSPPSIILSPAEETQTDGQKDRDTESRPGTC